MNNGPKGNSITDGLGMTVVPTLGDTLKMYGRKLNPDHSLRLNRGMTETREKVIIMHNPSEIDQNQLLLVSFPNLGSDDIIIPGMAKLSFKIKLTSMANPNRMLVT